MAKLIVKDPTKTRVVALKGKTISVGRASSNSLALRDTSLSRNHCEIRIEDETCTLHDLGSRNGTLVNGVQIKEHVLEVGDKVEIGNSMLVFERELPDRDYTLKPKEKDFDAGPVSSDDNATHETEEEDDSDDATMLNAGPKLKESRAETRTEPKKGSNVQRKPNSGKTPTVAASAPAADDVSVWTRSSPLGLVAGIAAAVIVLGAGGYFLFGGPKKDAAAGDSSTKSLIGAAGAFDAPGGVAWKAREGGKGTVTRQEQGGKTGGCLEIEVPAGDPLVEAVGPVAPVTAGRCYRISFEAQAEAADVVAGARLTWMSGETPLEAGDRTLLATAAPTWSRAERILRAPPGCDKVQIALLAVGDAGRVRIDDLAFEETKTGPEKEREESAGAVTVSWAGDARWTLRVGETVLIDRAAVGWVAGEMVVDQTLARDVRPAQAAKGAAWKLAHPFTGRWEPFSAELRLEDGMPVVVTRLPARTARGLDALTIDLPVPGEPAGYVAHNAAGEKKYTGEFEAEGVEALQVTLGTSPFVLLYGAPVHLRVVKSAGGVVLRHGFPGKKVDELKEFAISVATGPEAAKAVQRGPSLATGEAAEKRGELGRALKIYKTIAADPKGGAETQTAADKVRTLEARVGGELEETRRRMEEAAELDSDEICRGVERTCARLAGEYEGADFAAQAGQVNTENAALRKTIAERRQSAEASKTLAQGKGFVADFQYALARALFQSVVTRFPGTEFAKDAQTCIEALPK